jgi:hypothetical protein
MWRQIRSFSGDSISTIQIWATALKDAIYDERVWCYEVPVLQRTDVRLASYCDAFPAYSRIAL